MVALPPLLLSVSALAQYKCTRPSGVVIFYRLSACPADALQSVSIGQVPDSVRPEFEGTYREPPASEPARPAQARPAPPQAATTIPVERDIVKEANAICALLKIGGATACEIDVNIFVANVIDATVATTPHDAQKSHLIIANMTRQPGSPFVGRGW